MIRKEDNRLEQGQSMVEFAVSAIVILIVLVAIIDFGRAFFTYVALRDAAQEGAFYASICPADITGITTRARQTSTHPVNLAVDPAVEIKAYYSISGSNYQPATSAAASALSPGQDMVLVEVLYKNFEITTPLLGSFLQRQALTLKANASDHVLRRPTNPPSDPCP